jgi:hypothetical protein
VVTAAKAEASERIPRNSDAPANKPRRGPVSSVRE